MSGRLRSAIFVPFSMKLHTGSVYIHWPYCAKRCSYCNFNKYILSPDKKVRGKTPSWIVPEKRLANGLITELRTLLRISGIERITSVYFGGGTPSLMDPSSVQSIIREIEKDKISQNAEITLEANPEDIFQSQNKLEKFKSAGINRISLGIQAFNDADLKEMNRSHNVKESHDAIDNSIRIFGADRVSLDLIFGRNANQTLHSWIKELESAIHTGVGHLSLYQLTIERGTPLWKSRRKAPCKDLVNEMYIESHKKLQSHGFTRYEVSNFARWPSTISQHNSHYWKGGEYIGIGPGAHGRFRVRTHESNDHLRASDILRNKAGALFSPMDARQERIQTLEPHEWIREVEMVGHGTRKVNPLSSLDSSIELLGSGLRTLWGVESSDWVRVRSEGVTLSELVFYSNETKRLYEEGFFLLSSKGLSLSEVGMNIADYISSCLIANLMSMQEELENKSCL